MRAIFATVVFTGAALAAGCSNKAIDPPAQAAAAPAEAGKIPITTSADGARQEFLEGRSLAERLRVTDSIAHFDKAIALDPSFGLAELARANASPTGTEFLAHLAKAVAAADRLSDGEKLQIAAANAGANARGPEQRRLLEQLVAAYPQDERAHFALGAVLFGQQDPAGAIEHFKHANAIAPNYSAPYNQMGYAYRQLGDFANAEQAFKKYIELIPNDPNPYDSYAELLLKMGRFDESIAQYRKALSIDEHFLNSHMGIAADLMYQNKAAEAAAEAAQIVKKARTDAETRTGMFVTTSLHVYDGEMADALKTLDDQFAVAQKSNDTLGMVGDLQAKAAIYHRDEEAGRRAGDVRQGHRAGRRVEPAGSHQGQPAPVPSQCARARGPGQGRPRRRAKRDRGVLDGCAEGRPVPGPPGPRAGGDDRASEQGLGHGAQGARPVEPAERLQRLPSMPGLQGQGRRGQGGGAM